MCVCLCAAVLRPNFSDINIAAIRLLLQPKSYPHSASKAIYPERYQLSLLVHPLKPSIKMVRPFLSLFLAPFSALTVPTSSSASQLVIQLSDDPVNAVSAPPPSSSAVRQVYQFKEQMALENLEPRSNGQLVLTVSSQPEVYNLDPSKPGQPPTLVHQFPNVSSVTGIAEIAPDVFAVVAGNWSAVTLTAVPGTFSIWSIDFTTSSPTAKMIAPMPEAAALNGAATLDGSPDLLLIADSTLGAVWRLNVTTGDYSIAIQDPLLSNWSSPIPIGINGIRTFRGSVYFLNSALGSYGRVPVSSDGSPTGEVEVIARVDVPAVVVDDFDIDWAGNAWIATHPNVVTQVSPEGIQRNFTGDNGGNGIEMSQPTSARFGRGSAQEGSVLYVVTGGSETAGGQIIALNTWMLE